MLLFWRFNEHKLVPWLMVVLCFAYQDMEFCSSLNYEGLVLLRFKERVESDPFGALSNWKDDVGEENPCSWFGVGCSEGHVVVLDLKDLCLKATLAPDLGSLVHIKSIILRNNSFSGIVPAEIAKLKELEMLDLGYNNFTGPLPSDLGNNFSLTILLLDNNDVISGISPEIDRLKMLSEVQTGEDQLSKATCFQLRDATLFGKTSHRKLLQSEISKPPPQTPNIGVSRPPSPSPSRSHSSSRSPSPSPSPSRSRLPRQSAQLSLPSTGSGSPSPDLGPVANSNSWRSHLALILAAAIGGPFLVLALVIIIVFIQGKKVAVVKPWATGLSGQLQKAFVTGVPKLKKSEIEAACEDFSNVIGHLSVGTLYKGTLSSGVEIAVVFLPAESVKDWSKNLETEFRRKIDILSKVNHKNFVNLLGYCEEDQPFTRMIVFEYAPNGTLFEHLHIKEAEHLDWGMRMRIAMGMAYCLEYMHQLTPPLPHRNLTSSAVYLTDDYAAKVSDFTFTRNEAAADEMEPNLQSNVYSFGVILFEMITGRLPFSVDNGFPEDWASDYLCRVQHLTTSYPQWFGGFGLQHLTNMTDPTLESFQEKQLAELGEVIKSCVHPNPELRPAMSEVTARLRKITSIGPDGAIPKVSPLWWAELEILSSEVN